MVLHRPRSQAIPAEDTTALLVIGVLLLGVTLGLLLDAGVDALLSPPAVCADATPV